MAGWILDALAALVALAVWWAAEHEAKEEEL